MPGRWSRICRPLGEGIRCVCGRLCRGPLEVLVRFGRWDEILAEPANYPEGMLFTRAFHHAARAIALAAKGEAANARKDRRCSWRRLKAGSERDAAG